VKFDTDKVTSVDWLTYPILDIADMPEAIDIVQINHPEIAPSGAVNRRSAMAAPSPTRFRCTGVRCVVSFSPERVKRPCRD